LKKGGGPAALSLPSKRGGKTWGVQKEELGDGEEKRRDRAIQTFAKLEDRASKGNR